MPLEHILVELANVVEELWIREERLGDLEVARSLSDRLRVVLAAGVGARQNSHVAVQLDVNTDLLVERIAGRAKAEGRADDTPEAVRHRLNVYNDSTAPVVDFYRTHGTLVHVDGVGGLDDVFNRIIAAISHTHDVG